MMLQTNYEGEELTHRILWRIVEQNAKIASESVEGSFYPVLVSEVFAFHTIEAYVNFVGGRIAPEIWNDERNYFRRTPHRGWDGKLTKVLDLVGLSYDRDCPPLSTVLELRRIRDLIAHGKPETIAGEAIHSPDSEPPILPPSTLRSAVAERERLPTILTDVEQFLDAVHTRAAPIVKRIWGRTDKTNWFGTQALRGTARYSSGLTTLHRPPKPF